MSSPAPGGFSLFPSPNTSKPPPPTQAIRNQTPGGRRSESRERRVVTPVGQRAATPSIGGSPERRRDAATPLTASPYQNHQQQQQQQQQRPFTPVEFRPAVLRKEAQQDEQQQQWPLNNGSPSQSQSQRQQQQQQQQQPIPTTVQQPRPVAEVPGRTETAFSEANTLVRGHSVRSRSSIAKIPFPEDPSSFSSSSEQQQPLRSIFPTYNPDLPLDQQNYVPTQMSPTRIPRAVISRQTYHADAQGNVQSPPVRSPVRSPLSAESGSRWPRRPANEPPVIPTPCTTEQLKSLWRVANGWKASASEGRVYCMHLSQQKDAPVYTLASSTNQPFYNLRLDPTSASAYVTLTRYDPSKPYKAPKAESSSPSASSSSRSSVSKHWHESLTTTLEEESRRRPPNDGLVALLMPSPATKMAIERADDIQAVMMAEKECARLVWDDDSASHFLVHPALATPFCIAIERSPAWSRVEYTLEHHESPQHLAKLTRDGTGAGWLEIDTGLASKIDSFFIIDVAVTALILVASFDEKNAPAVEVFEPPPPVVLSASDERRLSRSSKREEKKEKKRRKMEAFEIDVESQDDGLGKSKGKDGGDEKLPFLLRVIVKLVKGLFKCFIWILTIGVKIVVAMGKGVYKCVGSKY